MIAARRCEETSPITGQRCRAAAVVVIERYGAPFLICAACALRIRHLRAIGKDQNR